MLQDLVDIVSKNGCVLLNIAPRADGSIPQEQVDRLLAIGKWLDINGEAIYATRPWKTFGEGPAIIPEGHLADLKFKGFCAEDIRFTQSKDGKTLYVHCLDKPEGNSISIKSLGIGAGHLAADPRKVTMPGSDAAIQWSRTADAMKIEFPTELSSEHVYVFQLDL